MVCGLVNFVPAVAYIFCLNLPAAFSQPRTNHYFRLCMSLALSLFPLNEGRFRPPTCRTQSRSCWSVANALFRRGRGLKISNPLFLFLSFYHSRPPFTDSFCAITLVENILSKFSRHRVLSLLTYSARAHYENPPRPVNELDSSFVNPSDGAFEKLTWSLYSGDSRVKLF